MPAQSKLDMLEKVSASLEASQGLFVVDYRGLTVKESQELRRKIHAAGGDMKVYKNNIVKIALEKAEMPAIDDILVNKASPFYDGYNNTIVPEMFDETEDVPVPTEGIAPVPGVKA